MYDLKFKGELCAMTMKNDTKTEEELTFHFKTGMRDLTNFDSSTWKSKIICSLIGSFDQSRVGRVGIGTGRVGIRWWTLL